MQPVTGKVKTNKLVIQGHGAQAQDVSMLVESDTFNIKMGNDVLMSVGKDDIGTTIDDTDSNNITISKNTVIEGNLTVKDNLFVNDLGTMDKTNSVGLVSHHHMKNYAEMEHHHVHGSGFKMEHNGETYVVTSAHNAFEVQFRPTEFGLEHVMDLPYQQGGVVSKNNRLAFGDGDTIKVNDREILCCSSSAGTFFWDVTRADFAFASLIDFKPRLNRNDARYQTDAFNSPKLEQIWNQVKCNKNTKMVYEQMGEILDLRTYGYPTDDLSGVSINIYDASKADLNEIKLVNKFQDKWSLSNPGHYKILNELYANIHSKALKEDGSQVYPTFLDWVNNVVDTNVIPSNHNVQISSDANLMFVCGVSHWRGSPAPMTNGGSRWSIGGVLVYDIDPNRQNPQTLRPCSESPYFLSIAGGEANLKVLTENEKALLYSNELFDENKKMKLDLPIEDPGRPFIRTTSYGYLPESISGDPMRGNLYVHDCWSIRSENRDLLYITKAANGGWPLVGSPESNPANYFGHTMGDFVAFDVTNIRSDSDLPVHQFPMHPDNPIGGLPGGGYPHNLTPRTDNKYVYCGYELPDGPGNASLDHTVQTKIYIFDTSDLGNIEYMGDVANIGTIKQVKNSFGQYDVNHNFDTMSWKGRDYLAFADYVDGFHLFDITGDNGKSPVQIGWGNPKERLMRDNPWYTRDDLETTYPFQADVSYDQWSNCWGLKFGSMGNLYVMNYETPCVYNVANSGTTDIRNYTNMMKTYTKYPEMSMPSYFKCIDSDTDKVVDLELVAMDQYSDVAVLKAKNGELSGGVKLAANTKLGEQVICAVGNGTHGDTILKGMVCGLDQCASPQLVQRVSRVDTVTKLSDGHDGVIEQVHGNSAMQDVGLAADTASVHSASVCSIGFPAVAASLKVPKGGSGAPLLNMKGELVGMVNYRNTDGSIALANNAQLVAQLAGKMIDNTYKAPYMGVQLLQDVLVSNGYMVTSVDGAGPAITQVTEATAAYEAIANLTEDESLAWAIVAVNGVTVGPRAVPITKLLLGSDVGTTVAVTVKPYKSYMSMGSTKYAPLELDNATFDLTLAERPAVLRKFEELPDSVNPNPSYTWFWEEKLGFHI